MPEWLNIWLHINSFWISNTSSVSIGLPLMLTAITEFVSQVLYNKGITWAVALDISKVFNRVWHTGLTHKLKWYSVSGWIFELIQLFLTCCVMKIMLNGHSSNSFYINEGDHWGSILRPTL